MLTHRGTQTIETARLTLRRITTEDAQAMFDNWASDPAVTEFLSWQAHESVEATREIIRMWSDAYHDDTFYQWVIVPKTYGEPVGTISVISRDDTVAKAEIGYCIGRAWWHHGITSEALRAVMDYLFDEVGMNRIEAKHDIANPHSGGVMKKCGMRFEGVSRQAHRNHRGICDAAHYALLKGDRV